ncbi:hypothetical protein A3860_12085 [Niastella vici]|uniref:Peptidase M56 domain-containing protein n=1 Tax=Niastella vici TaxID=1703345 RepID=A0A1V9FGE4_9BACT|nr:M56 family metallopeptidase [Niastella vici]OQP57286.1 hypothetical protein A3860_12085 [Niastella vici]
MGAILLYLLKANLVISIFFLAYYCLLRKEKFFRLNRIVLLSAIGLAFLLPLLPALESTTENGLRRGMWAMRPFSHWEHPFSDAPDTAAISPHVHSPVSTLQPAHNTIPVIKVVNILDRVYFLVAVVLLLRLLFQIQQVCRIIRRSRREKVNGIIYCYHELDLPVFSFFRCLVMNKGHYPPADVEQIISHEQEHIRQGHNFDLLLVELVHALCWINPFLIGLKRTVKLNLEFLADKAVLDKGADPSSYQYSMLRCLRPSGLPLVNLFASSKIKTRIYMMNKKSSPIRNMYKYALVLPLLTGCYFMVNPLKARSMPSTNHLETVLPPRQDLKAFEGYYLADFDKDTYIQIRATGNQLILKQLWNDREIVFNQQSALEFLNVNKDFPLKFFKNDQGAVVQLLAYNKDHWNKVKSYAPPKYIHLQAGQLKSFEGYYQIDGQDGKRDYIQIESTPDGLKLREGWTGREIMFRPTAATEFFAQQWRFPLQFTKDDNGNVTQVLAFHRDLWKKMQDPSTAVMKKEVKLQPAQLKALEGKYQIIAGDKLTIKAEKEGIVLTQLWDNVAVHLVPSSATEFFSKENGMPLVFTLDQNGVATEVLAYEKDRWTKIKE